MRENIKGRFLRKLKTISTPIWTSTLVFQPSTPNRPDLRISETSMDAREDDEEKVHSSESKEEESNSISSHEKPSPLSGFETSTEVKEDEYCNYSSSNPNAGQKLHSPESKEEEERNSISSHVCADKSSPLSGFQDRCPPGGQDAVVVYTTSLRGIRKTFEDCNAIRFLLESFRVVYSERDVSMHLEYREELWKVLEGRAVPPKVFIRGRYIGGADEVVGLHEKGRLEGLLRGIPLSPSRRPCGGCGGVRFVLCPGCSGSRKVVAPEDGAAAVRCPDCNENGLVKCSICSIF